MSPNREAGAVILSITYGYDMESRGLKKDPLIEVAEEAIEQFSLATLPDAWLVDRIPFCKFLPMKSCLCYDAECFPPLSEVPSGLVPRNRLQADRRTMA